MTKQEPQMICPKAKECGNSCPNPYHQMPHLLLNGLSDSCVDFRGGCPACIPVEHEKCLVCGHKKHGGEDKKCLEVVYQDEFSNKQYCQCMGSIEGYPDSRKVKQPTPTEQMPLIGQGLDKNL